MNPYLSSEPWTVIKKDKIRRHLFSLAIFTFVIIQNLSFVWAESNEATVLRLGHFPNVTHAQAVLAHGSGEFEKAIGVPIQWTTFNAGPSAIAALLAGVIDATYIGPNPAMNGYVKTHGEGLRIVVGSTSGGSALVVHPDSHIKEDQDFHGKIVATPQLGNTQDITARIWFKKKGYQLKDKGGSLTLLSVDNSNQLLLFRKKEIDAAWTIEPWVSRLEIEAHGKVFLDEKSLWPDGRYITTHLIVGHKFLEKNRSLIKKLVQAHIEITQRLNADKMSAIKLLNEELKRETGKELPIAVIRSALDRVEFTWDPLCNSLFKSAEDAYQIGFLHEHAKLDGIYDLMLLNEVLQEKKLPLIK